MAMESVEVAKTVKPEEYPMSRNFLILQVVLRLLAGVATLAAAVIMVVNKKTFVYFGLSLTAKYSYSGAYEFFVAANSIAFAYSVMSAVFLKLKSSSSKPKSQFLIFFFDLTTVALLIAGCSAATAVGYIAKYGNAHAGWIPVCHYMEPFCTIGLIPIVLSFGAFLVFYLLAAITMKSPRQIPVASC